MTDVIFRKFKNGQVIALFPFIVATLRASECGDYMRIGQHGACDLNYTISITKLASVKEYTPLLKELIEIGYTDLVIRKRATRRAYEERVELIKDFSRREA